MALIILNETLNLYFENFLLNQIFQNLGIENYQQYYLASVSILLIVILFYEFARLSTSLDNINIKPDKIFIISFLALSFGGAGLLLMPAMTIAPGSMPVVDALFTAVSATCVTGLIVVDTATFFTVKGQFIIMILIQLGGLGIISFATFFATFLRGRVGVKQKSMIPDYMDAETIESARNLLKQIIIMTFLIEGFAFILIYLSWEEQVEFANIFERIFYSAFHSVSAFCNAGFTLFSGSMYHTAVRDAYFLHTIIAFTIILGSIGFSPLYDIFSPKNLRNRMKYPWKDWKIGTKIAIHTAFFLLIFGTATFYLLESDNTLEGMNFSESLIASFFQSVNRTSGFNTVDLSQLRIPTLIIIIFLMFIGGSSGSTSGGIKTSTFYLLVVSAAATIRGKLRIEISRKYIPSEVMFRAFSIFFFAATFNLMAIFILSLTESHLNIVDITFEQVSAFGTVGYSTGITGQLTEIGKLLISLSMFIGRIGPLTFALALSRRVSTRSYKYPSAYIMVG